MDIIKRSCNGFAESIKLEVSFNIYKHITFKSQFMYDPEKFRN